MAITAVVGAAVAGGIAQGVTGAMAGNAQANAAQKAALTMQGAEGYAKNQWATAGKNFQPYMQMGKNALPYYQKLLGINNGTTPGSVGGGVPNTTSINNALMNMPGFQFANYWGQRGVQNSYAARGLGQSGAALKGAANFATGLAQQNYQNYLSDVQNAVGIGQNATNNYSQGALTSGNQIIQAAQGVGSAQEAVGQGQAAGLNSIGAGVNNALTGAAQGYMGMNYLNQNSSLLNSNSGMMNNALYSTPMMSTPSLTMNPYQMSSGYNWMSGKMM